MKRLAILFMLIPLTGCFLFAIDGDSNVSLNVGVSTLFLANSKDGELDKAVPLHPITFSSLAVGIGGHLEIIPSLLSPGIYGDLHLSLLSMLVGWLTKDENYETKNSSVPLFFQTGIRVYNQFSVPSISIQPFVGLNWIGVMSENSSAKWFKTFGILASYNKIGIEYSYQTPFFHRLNNTSRAIHRITALYRVSM